MRLSAFRHSTRSDGAGVTTNFRRTSFSDCIELCNRHQQGVGVDYKSVRHLYRPRCTADWRQGNHALIACFTARILNRTRCCLHTDVSVLLRWISISVNCTLKLFRLCDSASNLPQSHKFSVSIETAVLAPAKGHVVMSREELNKRKMVTEISHDDSVCSSSRLIL